LPPTSSLELAELAPHGFVLLEQERVTRLSDELRLSANPEEKSDGE